MKIPLYRFVAEKKDHSVRCEERESESEKYLNVMMMVGAFRKDSRSFLLYIHIFIIIVNAIMRE
jgi:hypothetical protein